MIRPIATALLELDLCGSIYDNKQTYFLSQRRRKAFAQLRKIIVDLDHAGVSRNQKLPLRGGDGYNAAIGVYQMRPCGLWCDHSRLESEDARNNLKTVGHSVLHFSNQHVLIEISF